MEKKRKWLLLEKNYSSHIEKQNFDKGMKTFVHKFPVLFTAYRP